jgi:proline iminopeptidase
MATDLIHRSYGDSKNRAVVFLHGGPGANSYAFEQSTAQKLADLGNYVVTYDQRGSGRSPSGVKADFTFENATLDLENLIKSLGLQSPILVGHSWGGFLSLKYAKLRNDPLARPKGIVLLGSPIDFPTAYDTMLTGCYLEYEGLGPMGWYGMFEVTKLRAKMFPDKPFNHVHFRQLFESLTSRSAQRLPFEHEDIQRLWTHVFLTALDHPPPHLRSPASKQLWLGMLNGPDANLVLDFKEAPRRHFHDNEPGYVDISHIQLLKDIVASNVPVHAIYGKLDRLFSDAQVLEIRNEVSNANFSYLGATGPYSAGHYMYVDLNHDFLVTLSNHLDMI